MRSLVFSLFILLLATSCSQSKTSTKVNATVSIMGGLLGAGSEYLDGGLMIFGKQRGTNQSFSTKYLDNDIVLENGVWDFIAVGWDNTAFVGDQRCATAFGVGLNGGAVDVNFVLNTANCNGSAFGSATTKLATGQPKPLRLKNCSHFYGLYSDGNEDSCYMGAFKSYKVAFPKSGPPDTVPLESGCFSYNNPVTNYNNGDASLNLKSLPTNLKLPIIAFPDGEHVSFTITGYEDFACAGVSENFNFLKFPPMAGLPYRAEFNDRDTAYNDFTLVSDTCSFPTMNTATSRTFTHQVSSVVKKEILLCTKAQVAAISANTPNVFNAESSVLNTTFILAQNINMSGQGLSPIGSAATQFMADFNGMNYNLSNISMTGSSGDYGFFGVVEGVSALNKADIKNLVLEDATIYNLTGAATTNVGILAGHIKSFVDLWSVKIKSSTLNLDCTTAPCLNAGQLAGKVNGLSDGINLDNFSIESGSITIGGDFKSVGMAIGQLNNNVRIHRAKVTGATMTTISSDNAGSNIGGLIGELISGSVIGQESDIWGAVVDVKIGTTADPFIAATLNSNIGGLIGSVTAGAVAGAARINNVKATGSMMIDSSTASEYIGGAFGVIGTYNAAAPGYNMMENVITNIDIDAINASHVGGIVGLLRPSGTNPARFLRSFGSIDCNANCGGIVGTAKANTSIEKSFSRSNITGIGELGGIFGQANDNNTPVASFTQTFATGNISGTTGATGAFGGYLSNNGAAVSESFSSGSVSGAVTQTGLFIGVASNTGGVSYPVTRSFSTSSYLSGSQETTKKGVGANPHNGTNYMVTCSAGCFLKNDSATTDNAFTSIASASVPITAGYTPSGYDFSAAPLWYMITGAQPSLSWAKAILQLSEDTLGTELDPFVLTTTAQWNAIGDTPSLMTAYLKLGGDLDFSGVSFNPIGSMANTFNGSLQGNNFAIENINSSADSTSAPLGIFRALGAGTYGPAASIYDFDEETFTSRKLYLKNNNFYKNCVGACTDSYVGTLAGYVADDGAAQYQAIRIKNVEVSGGSVGGTSDTQAIGGLIGKLSFQNPNTQVGTIVSSVDINACGSVGKIGGIIGYMYQVAAPASALEFRHWKYSGDINCSAAYYVGGLIGQTSANGGLKLSMEDMLVEDGVTIVGNNYTGGLFGQMIASSNFYLDTAYSKADVTGNQKVGGIAGNIQGGNISGVYSNGIVNGASNTGAFAGYLDGGGTVANSYTSGIGTASDTTNANFIGPATTWSCPTGTCYFLDDTVASGSSATLATSKTSIDLKNNTAGTLIAASPWFFDGINFPIIIPEKYTKYFGDQE